MSGVIQYPEDTDFSQANPVGISIGTNECTTDIYCIRVYSNNLSQYQILDNWIADTQDIEELIARYDRNNVFDDYGNVDVTKLPQTLPYLVVDAKKYSDLPQYKGNKKTVDGKYVDPLRLEKSFSFNGAEIDVQGTSSQFYSRKNYKIKFKKGFTINGVAHTNYSLRDTSMPTNTFTFKADVASSEGVNNVELCKLYDDICPVDTPPQSIDKRVRQGIEGYPCLMFYYDGENYHFVGKYNFNNDKGTPEVFGLDDNDESWEILLNNTKMAKWKDTDFETPYIDEEDGKEKPLWMKTFEARHPEDNTNIINLKDLAVWLNSTDTTAVDSEEEKAARLEKFRNGLERWFNVDMLIFNYIFTEAFLLVDNRAKNAFPTRYDEDGKWVILPYDYDTAIGANNEGKMQFSYQFEDTDFIRGKELITAEQAEEEGIDVETDDTVDYTYNGQDSVLYVNLRKCFAQEIKAMYQELRNDGALSYEEVERRFSEHQNVWGEAVFNEDARFKYIDPLIEEGNSTYLPMLQGSKSEQRKWWLYNRFRYLDSKYNTGDAKLEFINLKAFALSNVSLVPYADIYATALFDNTIKQTRAFRGKTCTIENPADLAQGQVIAIYSASQIAQIGDLSGFDLGLADFHMATRLSGTLKIGDENRTNAKLTELTIGNLTLLSVINAMNCTALKQTVDVSGCTNIEELYFQGSSIMGVKLPNGGILTTLHLPETVTSLNIQNQPLLSKFSIPTFSNISSLRLENVDFGLFDFVSILRAIKSKARVRLRGIEMNIATAEEIFAFYDELDKKEFRGLDEYNGPQDKAVIEGTIHCGTITGAELLQMQTRYPNITIDFEHITSNVYFYVEGELVHTAIVLDGGDCYDPITEGLIDTPTRAETDTTKFIFKGWDDDLKAITADRIVHAEFNEHIKYVVVFYNGETLISRTSCIKGDSIVTPEKTPTKESTAQYKFVFKGWSLDGVKLVEVPKTMNEENLTYYAIYESVPREYTITWTLAGTSITTTCEYGKVPEIPDYYAAEKVLTINDVQHTIKGYSPDVSEITGDTTYKVVATKPASTIISARPTLAGARSADAPDPTEFLTNTGKLNGSYAKYYYIILYGFDFEQLRGASDVTITDMNVFFGDSFTYNSPAHTFSFVRNFETSGSNYSAYKDIGDGAIKLPAGYANDKGIDATVTYESFPKTIEWIRNNISDFVDGHTRNTFGMLVHAADTLRIRTININITCTFTETVIG